MLKEKDSRTLLERLVNPEILRAQEFQSAIVRILVWVLMMVVLGLGGARGIYPFEWELFWSLFVIHLVWFVGLLVHVIRNPRLTRWRTYLGVISDMSGTSLSIYLSGNPISPFYLLYILSFLSQGTRYGRDNLAAASVASVAAFTAVTMVLGGWPRYAVEISFMLLFLMVLPLYQYVLLGKLHAAKQAAEAANQARGNFLATMTHELRTPLTGVIGMAGLLNGTRLNDEQREYLESINASASVLQSLIGDILDLSKIDAGKLELKGGHFDIRAVLVETVAPLGNQALDKGVELVCHVDAVVPEQVYGDELRFRQILFNLVGNAVKFTEQGEVCIRVTLQNADSELRQRHLKVSVRDTGIGIPADKLAQIFNSFWQQDASTTRRYGGTGLGTTIARDLAHLMGGAIGVSSREGQGSEFWIKLPLLDREALHAPRPPRALDGLHAVLMEPNSAALGALRDACEAAGMKVTCVSRIEELGALVGSDSDAAVAALLLSDSPRGTDLAGVAAMMRNILKRDLPVLYLHYPRRKITLAGSNAVCLAKPYNTVDLWRRLLEVIDPGQLSSAGPVGQPRQEATVEGIRVLVAEDDSINAKLVHSLLSKRGHLVTLVRDGEAALKAASEADYDIALIDLRMPKLDGIDFSTRYRAAEEPGKHLPIIALTANAAEDARADCMQAGMDEFLTKPIDPQVLERLLRDYTGQRG